jgi:aminoglycoside phosphotransferase (APT) family kinase protein
MCGWPARDGNLPGMRGSDTTGSPNRGRQRPFTPDSTIATLRQACQVVGLDAADARLVRLGSNAVYRLVIPVVARISRSSANVDDVSRTVSIARWLESVDYPAVRALAVEQPVIIDGHVVTFWEALSDNGDQYGSVEELAHMLVELHSLKSPDSLSIPALAPFEKADRRIMATRRLAPEDRSFLIERLAELQVSYASLDFVLPEGLIHGDASVGNVLLDRHGNPVLIDLDSFAIGPREWDLALTAIYYDSFGWHTRQEYEKFPEIYGFDIMQWPGYPVMRDVREFLMVAWLSQKADESEQLAEEVASRVSSLRTGSTRKNWQPH